MFLQATAMARKHRLPGYPNSPLALPGAARTTWEAAHPTRLAEKSTWEVEKSSWEERIPMWEAARATSHIGKLLLPLLWLRLPNSRAYPCTHVFSPLAFRFFASIASTMCAKMFIISELYHLLSSTLPPQLFQPLVEAMWSFVEATWRQCRRMCGFNRLKIMGLWVVVEAVEAKNTNV